MENKPLTPQYQRGACGSVVPTRTLPAEARDVHALNEDEPFAAHVALSQRLGLTQPAHPAPGAQTERPAPDGLTS